MTADPARHRRLSALFLAARELEPDEREAFLESECAADAALLRDVKALLASDDENFLDEPPLGPGAAAPAAALLDAERDAGRDRREERSEPAAEPERIGPFKILSKLGQGGMGVVYAAEQENPHRRIALKVLRGALSSSEARRRFDYESGVLARLRHPCIAQVYEVGALPWPSAPGETTPYFAMELIEGARPITEYANDEGLDLERRLDLFARVLDGVHHGHQRGIVHRDLKPANILVDAEGNPKIIDFGVARVLRTDESLGTVHTMAGQLVGTLEYMSPEHVSGDPEDVDSRADVYSMGVVLFELVSGRLPYDFDDAGVLDAIRKIREARPRRLSTLFSRFRGDLDTIADKALSKDRDRRYASASELAADIRRFLKHEAIAARPASAFYQLRLFARRNRPAVAAAAVVLAALVLGVVVSARFAWIADERADRSRRDAYRANLLAAGLAIDAGQILDGRIYLDRAAPEMRGWEWRHLLSRTLLERKVLGPFDGGVTSVAPHPGRSEVAVVTLLGGVFVVDAATGGRRPIELGGMTVAREAHYDPAGRLLHVAGDRGSHGWWIAAFDADTGRRVGLCEFEGLRRRRLAFHDASGRFAAVAEGRGVEIRRLSDGALLARRPIAPEIHAYSRPAFSPDGRVLAVMSARQEILLLDGSTLETVRTLGPAAPLAIDLAFDSSGSWLAAGCEDGEIGVWNLGAAAASARRSKGHGGSVLGLAFHPREPVLVSAGNDAAIRVYDLATGACRAEIRGHDGWVAAVSFFPDGGAFVSSSTDGTLRVYDLALLDDTTALRGHASYVNPVAVSPDGSTVVSGGWDGFAGAPGALRYWDAESGEPVGAWKGLANVVSLSYAPEGDRIAAGSNATVFMVDASTGKTRSVLRDLEGYATVSFSPDGALLAVGDNREVALFDSRTYSKRARLPRAGGSMTPPLFSKDGSRVAVSRGDGTYVVANGKTLAAAPGLARPGNVAALSSDGRRAVSIDADRVRIHDTRDFGTIAEIPAKRVMQAAFSPGDDRLFIGGLDGPIQVHDGRTYDEVARLRGHTAYVFSFAFDAKGERLFTGSGDGTIRIWETRSVADRVLARREWKASLESVLPRVRELFDSGVAAEEVVARLRAAEWASDRERTIALQAALGEALARDADPSGSR